MESRATGRQYSSTLWKTSVQFFACARRIVAASTAAPSAHSGSCEKLLGWIIRACEWSAPTLNSQTEAMVYRSAVRSTRGNPSDARMSSCTLLERVTWWRSSK